jgi:hypothetical protein
MDRRASRRKSMLELHTRITVDTTGHRTVRGQRTRLELELREMADDLAGRLDRDELSREDEALIAEAIDAALVAALPVVFEVLDRELTPRLEALPPKARLTLARARSRREYGLD